MMSLNRTGQWREANIFLTNLSRNITKDMDDAMRKSAELVLKRLIEKINQGDSSWKPLEERTVKLKGFDTIYIESGWLRDNFSIRKLTNMQSGMGGKSLMIGASPWKTHPSVARSGRALKFSDLMTYLEYGTTRMEGRPLLVPVFKAVNSEVIKIFKEAMFYMVKRSGG